MNSATETATDVAVGGAAIVVGMEVMGTSPINALIGHIIGCALFLIIVTLAGVDHG